MAHFVRPRAVGNTLRSIKICHVRQPENVIALSFEIRARFSLFFVFALPALANVVTRLLAIAVDAFCVVADVRDADLVPASRGRGRAGIGAADSGCLHRHEEG
jgi:hypothetical protein